MAAPLHRLRIAPVDGLLDELPTDLLRLVEDHIEHGPINEDACTLFSFSVGTRAWPGSTHSLYDCASVSVETTLDQHEFLEMYSRAKPVGDMKDFEVALFNCLLRVLDEAGASLVERRMRQRQDGDWELRDQDVRPAERIVLPTSSPPALEYAQRRVTAQAGTHSTHGHTSTVIRCEFPRVKGGLFDGCRFRHFHTLPGPDYATFSGFEGTLADAMGQMEKTLTLLKAMRRALPSTDIHAKHLDWEKELGIGLEYAGEHKRAFTGFVRAFMRTLMRSDFPLRHTRASADALETFDTTFQVVPEFLLSDVHAVDAKTATTHPVRLCRAERAQRDPPSLLKPGFLERKVHRWLLTREGGAMPEGVPPAPAKWPRSSPIERRDVPGPRRRLD